MPILPAREPQKWLQKYIRTSGFYPGCGVDFSLMFEIPSPPNWVFCDWGGGDQDGNQVLAEGFNTSSFGDSGPYGWRREGKIEDITEDFLSDEVIGVTKPLFTTTNGGLITTTYDDITKTYGDPTEIKQKVLLARFTNPVYPRGRYSYAIFCLGFEGIDLYKKLYRGRQCRFYMHKQGIGTKYSQDKAFMWKEKLTNAFGELKPDVLFNLNCGSWCDLPETVKKMLGTEGFSMFKGGSEEEGKYEIFYRHRPR